MSATVIQVGDREVVIERVTPAQVAGVLRILSRLSFDARTKMSKLDAATDNDLLWAFLGAITEEDLIELAALSIGSDKQFAEENFDLEWVLIALGALIKKANIGTAITNFMSALSLTED